MRSRSGSRRLDAPPPPTVRQILDEHMGLIMGSVRRVLGGGCEADEEEVAWDTLLHIHLHLHAFDPERGTLRAWIQSVATQRARGWRRVAGRGMARRLVPYADVQEEVDNRADQGPTAEEMMQTHEWMRLWDEVLPTLPEDERTVLAKHVQCGLTAEELATELGESVGTVKTRLRRAQQRIDAYLKRRQAAQRRRGAAVFPVSAAMFLTRIAEASQEVSDDLRARLASRLSAYLDGEPRRPPDHPEPPAPIPRPRVYQRVAPSPLGGDSGAAVGSSLVGAFVLTLTLTLLLLALLIPLLLRLKSSPGTATGAPANAPVSALAATASFVAAPVAMPSAATSGTTAVAVAAPDSTQAAPAPAPGSAHEASKTAQRRAIVTAFMAAIHRGDHVTACRMLGEYNTHRFVGAGAVADRAEMAKASACPK